MGDEDLPAVDDLSEGDRLVGPPFLDGLGRLGDDDVVVVGALEVDLSLLALSHDGQ